MAERIESCHQSEQFVAKETIVFEAKHFITILLVKIRFFLSESRNGVSNSQIKIIELCLEADKSEAYFIKYQFHGNDFYN